MKTEANLGHGIRENLGQFLHQLLQVLLVGFAIGMMRTVVPALAEGEFGVPAGSFMLLSAFVVAFGVVKGVLNFVAGRLSERIGRRNVLLLGWIVALPIPFLIYFAPDWNWIVSATVLLGVNQGLTWSMTQTSKLDLTRADERGLTLGLNEFAGYVGVALAGIATGYLATALGARLGLLLFGLFVTLLALLLTALWVKDTLPWAHAEAANHAKAAPGAVRARYPATSSEQPTTWEIFSLMSWRDRRLAAISQAGLVEKFVDALVWVFYPVFLFQNGVDLPGIGWIVGIYGLVWGGAQLFTGRLSDHIGRHWPNVAGMWICGAGVAMMVLGEGVAWWSASAAVSGLGMALLYPNLSAAVADISPPAWRGSAIGIYRFWRDLGYALGALGLGMALLYPNLSAAVADISPPAWRGSAIGIYRFWRDLGYAIGALGLGVAAHFTGHMEAAFWFVAVSMAVSGALLFWFGEETHPRLNPAAWLGNRRGNPNQIDEDQCRPAPARGNKTPG